VVDVLADLIPAPALDGASNPVYNRRQTTQRSITVHARISSYEGDVDRLIEGFERQADLVRGLDGFAHAYLLVDRAGSRAMIVALWNSADALDASASRAAHLREEASETAAATVGLVDSYEVALEVAGGAGD
jgi:heme-degrading monooxygenase HmoA